MRGIKNIGTIRVIAGWIIQLNIISILFECIFRRCVAVKDEVFE